MNKRVSLFLSLIGIMLFSTLTGGREASNPEIFFKEKIYNASEVMEGDLILHSYTVYNKGNAVLKIEKVRPG